MSDESRDAYIKRYKREAAGTITKERLPFVSDIMDFTLNGKTDEKLKRIFDFFGEMVKW